MPGSGPPPDPAIHEAQGVLRDAVSAAQNLLILLGSLRVAPRALSPLLSEVRASVEVTPDALASLLQRLALQREPAVLPLLSFLRACASETSRALTSVETSFLEARTRLALESAFRGLVPRLDAVRELAELLALTHAPAADLDLAELLEASFSPTSRSGLPEPSLRLSLDAPLRGAHLIHANPRAALRLLRLVLGYTHGGPDHGWFTPLANLHTRAFPPRVACVFAERPAPPQGDILLTRVPLLIPPTAPILDLFCASHGILLHIKEASPAATLAFPPA